MACCTCEHALVASIIGRVALAGGNVQGEPGGTIGSCGLKFH